MGADGVRAGLTLARAGDMRLDGVRAQRLFARLGVEAPAWVRQIHSRRVLVAGAGISPGAPLGEGDGLVTDAPGVFLAVTVADCLPIFLAERDGRAVGLVHSGWRGTGIAAEAVREMGRRWAVAPQRITATIGPGIGSCCYRVEEERYRGFRRDFGAASARGAAGDRRLDLVAANLRLLRDAGVGEIVVSGDCTCCNPLLGSFRRQGSAFTHMAAFIGRTSTGGARC